MLRTTRRRFVVLGGLTGLVGLAVACSGGVPQSEYDSAKQQLATEQQRELQYQQTLSESQKQVSDLQNQVAALQKAAPAAGAAGSTTSAAGVTTLLGVEVVPTPGPPPTPVPGATPKPKPVTPDSYYDSSVGPFYVYAETLATTSPSTYGLGSNVACTPSGIFKRGQKIVWRFEVIDTSNGKRVTDKDNAAITVHLPSGEDLKAGWAQRGGGSVPGAPFTWNAAWNVPLDYPLGGLDYSILVKTPDGRNVSWKPPALVSADEDTRPKIIS